MIVVLDRTWEMPFIVLPFLGGILWHVGVALMGVAVWRSDSLTTWGGITLLIAGILGIPGFLDVVGIQYISPVVHAIGLILVGLSLWQVRRRNEQGM